MSNILLVYPALVTWGAMALYLWTMFRIGGARKAHGVMPPRIDGPEAFQRVFRAHQNTLEQLMLFLPALWLFAFYLSPLWAGVLGALWLVVRVWYVIAYSADAGRRLPPFLFALAITAVLLLGALTGMIGAWLVI